MRPHQSSAAWLADSFSQSAGLLVWLAMSGDMDLGQEVVVEVESCDSLVTDQSS